jgi:CheY-like chemotaxis protein
MSTVSANEAAMASIHLDQTPASRRIRTLVAENSAVPGEVIRFLIRLEDYIEIVGKVTDGQEAIEAASALDPDLLLIDGRLPHIDGVTACGILSQTNPRMHIVVMFEQQCSRLRSQIDISKSRYLLQKRNFTDEFCRVLPKIKLRIMERGEQAGSATGTTLVADARSSCRGK